MAFKSFFFIFLLAFAPILIFAQLSTEYTDGVNKAIALFEAKDYVKSAKMFTVAFNTMEGKAVPSDRYNAACAWSMAGIRDSAFYHLNRLASNAGFTDYDQMAGDSDLYNLHSDERWNQVLALVKLNKDKVELNLNKPLVAVLDTVFQDDQGGRNQLEEVIKKYGQNSIESKVMWTTISKKDSIDLIKVKNILDVYGWLGADVVGIRGNQTIFLVIQHSDIKTQDKYLPMMREAVKNNKARPSDLALLEDRVALRNGRKQIYGSQIASDSSGDCYLSPLEDPDNVDKRRAEVGLQPIAEYLKNWNIKWDLAAFKKRQSEVDATNRK